MCLIAINTDAFWEEKKNIFKRKIKKYIRRKASPCLLELRLSRQPWPLFSSTEEESLLSLLKNIWLASSTINLAGAAPCSQYLSTDFQKIKTDKIKAV